MLEKPTFLSNRTVYILLLCLIIFGVVIRYPTTPNQMGVDGFMNNVLANSISENGNAKWFISPYSYLGLGPFSYPPSIHFLLSSTSQIADISVDVVVLIFTQILGLCGAMFIFIYVKEYGHDVKLALLSSFLFTTSPIFLRLTSWNGSSRSLLMIFIIMILIMIFKMGKTQIQTYATKNYSIYMFLVATFILMSGTIHRMYIFIGFILFGFIMVRPVYYTKKLFGRKWYLISNRKYKLVMLSIFISWVCLIALNITAQLNNYGPYQGTNFWFKYQYGLFFSGSDFFIVLSNMIIDYWSGWGLLFFFSIIGIYLLFQQRNKNYPLIYLLITILFMSPIASIGLYAELILIILILPFVAYGILWFSKRKYIKRFNVITVLTMLVISSAFSMFMVSHWRSNNDGDYMTEWEYDLGTYMRVNMEENDTFVSNHQTLGNRVHSISDSIYFTEGPPYALIYGFINVNEIEMLVDFERMIDERSIIIRYPEEINLVIDHRFILNNDVSQTNYLREVYGVNYVVEGPRSSTNFLMESSLENTCYSTFSNEDGRIWYIG